MRGRGGREGEPLMRGHAWRGPLLATAALTTIILTVLACVYWPLGDWIRYPLIYRDDGLWNLFVIKTVSETGWYGGNHLLGAPFGAFFYDFAKPEGLLLLLIAVVGRCTANVAFVHNLFFAFGFLVVGWSALWVLRTAFGLSWHLAVAGAVLFAMQPYHFARLEHLFLSCYIAVPLTAFLLMLLRNGRLPIFERRADLAIRISAGLCILAIGSTSIYYAFFALVLLFGQGVLEAVRSFDGRRLVDAVVVCSLLGTVVMVNLAPSLAYRFWAGANKDVAGRSVAEAEYFALKPVQMLLPPADHRSTLLSAPVRFYERRAGGINENRSSALGMAGATGFVLLFVLLASGHGLLANSPSLAVCARSSLLALALGMTGGLGTLIALLVSPQFRSRNRISIFIAFFALTGLCLLLERVLVGARRGAWLLLTAAGLLAFGLWDQIPRDVTASRMAIAQEFDSDRQFVGLLEKNLPLGAQILQFPYTECPEAPPWPHGPNYSHLRGYLHSATLRWSFGGMKGRDGDRWLREVCALPPVEMVAQAREKGFEGIWLDRRGYADNGQAMDAQLRGLGLAPKLSSTDGMLLFYPFESTATADEKRRDIPVARR